MLMGSPDHWHALHAIAAIEAGADVYLQKPISVDVLEGEAILAAARKHNRVVQVGTQRKSTPHLIDAKKQVVDGGPAGQDRPRRDVLLFPHAGQRQSSRSSPCRISSTTKCGPARRRCGRTMACRTSGGGGRSRNTATASSATCACTCSTPPAGCSSSAGRNASAPAAAFTCRRRASRTSPTRKPPRSNTTSFNAVWQHRTWGTPPDPDYPWALFIYGEKGTLKASTMRADFIPHDDTAKPIHFDCVFEREKYPEDVTETDIELNAAPATRRHMLDFLAAIDKRSRPVADIEQGHISTASCILANVAMQLGRPLVYDPRDGKSWTMSRRRGY